MSMIENDLRVLVLSGPSGSGKSTIVNRLVGGNDCNLVKSISATTRSPRPGEVDGQDYYFLTHTEFAAKRESGEFLECAELHGSGHWYGTLKSELRRARDLGGWAFLEIDVQGALNVMQEFPDAVTVFLKTPSEEEYEKRLRDRGSEQEDVILRRLQTARDELQLADRYRYQVINDDLDRAVKEITEIVSKEEEKRNA